MAEIWNFERDVWADMRRAVRATGLWSYWYKLLFSMTLLLSERAARAEWLKQQIWLDTASENGLDLFGSRYGILRQIGEIDSVYKARLETERLIMTGNGSNHSRKSLINYVYGTPMDSIQIHRVMDSHFTVGGVVGAPVGSRDYAMHAYRIYIPLPANVDEKIGMVSKVLDNMNIGGNVWELWLDSGAFNGVNTSDYVLGNESFDYPSYRNYRVV